MALDRRKRASPGQCGQVGLGIGVVGWVGGAPSGGRCGCGWL
jgi:hypothetical protein